MLSKITRIIFNHNCKTLILSVKKKSKLLSFFSWIEFIYFYIPLRKIELKTDRLKETKKIRI